MILNPENAEHASVITYLRETHPFLYHVTGTANIESIRTTGLRPKVYPPGDNFLREEISIICFCPQSGVQHMQSALSDKNNGDLSVLAIAHEDYITKDIDLDYTHTIIYFIDQQSALVTQFSTSLEMGFTITINEVIPANQIDFNPTGE